MLHVNTLVQPLRDKRGVCRRRADCSRCLPHNPHDNEVSLSQEDHQFLEITSHTAHKNSQGNWEMPLPFRKSDVNIPNNRSQAVNRLDGLLRSRETRSWRKTTLPLWDRFLNAGMPPRYHLTSWELPTEAYRSGTYRISPCTNRVVF